VTFDKVIFDIETTLNVDKIWCIVCKHKNTYYQFKEDKIHRFVDFLKQTKEVIGQDIADELKLVGFVDDKSSTQTIEKIQKGN